MWKCNLKLTLNSADEMKARLRKARGQYDQTALTGVYVCQEEQFEAGGQTIKFSGAERRAWS